MSSSAPKGAMVPRQAAAGARALREIAPPALLLLAYLRRFEALAFALFLAVVVFPVDAFGAAGLDFLASLANSGPR